MQRQLNIKISENTKETFNKICDKAGSTFEKNRYSSDLYFDPKSSEVAQHIVNYIDTEDEDEIKEIIPSLIPYIISFILAFISIFCWISYCFVFCCCDCCVPKGECSKRCCWFTAIILFGILIVTGVFTLGFQRYILLIYL